MIATDLDHLKKLEKYARKYLSVSEETRVQFGSMEDARAWLDRFEAKEQSSSIVAGYDVETIWVPPTDAMDHQYRRDQLRRSFK